MADLIVWRRWSCRPAKIVGGMVGMIGGRQGTAFGGLLGVVYGLGGCRFTCYRMFASYQEMRRESRSADADIEVCDFTAARS